MPRMYHIPPADPQDTPYGPYTPPEGTIYTLRTPRTPNIGPTHQNGVTSLSDIPLCAVQQRLQSLHPSVPRATAQQQIPKSDPQKQPSPPEGTKGWRLLCTLDVEINLQEAAEHRDGAGTHQPCGERQQWVTGVPWAVPRPRSGISPCRSASSSAQPHASPGSAGSQDPRENIFYGEEPQWSQAPAPRSAGWRRGVASPGW